jgi:hypothetical protein
MLRGIAAFTIMTAVVLVLPTGSASACSCDVQLLTVADAVGQSDIAFVGRIDSTETIDPADVARYLAVPTAVNGRGDGEQRTFEPRSA